MPSLQEIYRLLATEINVRYPQIARRYGVPLFIKKFERLMAETRRLGDQTPHLEARITALRQEASHILHMLGDSDEAAVVAHIRNYLGIGGIEETAGWVLWHIDTFDPGPASREAAGRELITGFRELWAHTLREAIRNDGAATFSRFRLAWQEIVSAEDERVHLIEIPVDPFDNPDLAKLRRWIYPPASAEDDRRQANERLLQKIAAWHMQLVQRSERWSATSFRPTAEAELLLNQVAKLERPEQLVATAQQR